MKAFCALKAMCMLVCGCAPIATVEHATVAPVGVPHAVSDPARVETLGTNLFKVRLTNIEKIAAKQPKDTQLCWAACAQMLLRAQNHDVSQEDLANHFVGGDPNKPVGPTDIIRALHPDLEKEYCEKISRGGTIPIVFGLNPAGSAGGVSSDWLIEELSLGNPAVTGICAPDFKQGHACVVVAATYSVAGPKDMVTNFVMDGFHESDNLNADQKLINSALSKARPRYLLHEIELIDPDPDAPEIVTMSASDFAKDERFLITSRFAAAAMREMIRNIQTEVPTHSVPSQAVPDTQEKKIDRVAEPPSRSGAAKDPSRPPSTRPDRPNKPEPTAKPRPKPKPLPKPKPSSTTQPKPQTTPKPPPKPATDSTREAIAAWLASTN